MRLMIFTPRIITINFKFKTMQILKDMVDFEKAINEKGNFLVWVEDGKGDTQISIDMNDFVSWMCLNGDIDEFKMFDEEGGEALINRYDGYYCQQREDIIENNKVEKRTFLQLLQDDIIDSEMIAKYLNQSNEYELSIW